MKKKLPIVLVLILLVSLFPTISMAANEPVKVTIDGNLVGFDVEPTIIEGRTLVPLRAIFETLGLTVGWDKETKTAIGEKDGLKIELPVGNKYAKKNGQQIELDVPATIIEGRTLVPVRFIAESTGATVNWNSTTRTVVIGNQSILKVHFIDVGQGDSILIEYGEFHALIDAGDNSAEDTVVNYLKEQNVDDLELFVATHSHADHIGGADTVLEAYDAEYIIDCDWINETKTFDDYKNAMMANSSDGKTIFRNNDNDIVLKINPDGTQPKETTDKEMIIKIIGNKENDDSNNSSTVVLLDAGDIEFLFTGDLEEEGEKELLNKFSDIEVLKAGHHGSNTASSIKFLNKIKPEYVIISAGTDNKYGHPHEEAIQNFMKFTNEIYGTYDNGTIIATTDGNTIRIDANNKTSINNQNEQIQKEKNNTQVADNIQITNVDLSKEVVTIRNNGTESVNLQGYKIVSVTGNQSFVLPSCILAPGAIVKVYSGKGTGDIKWTGSYIWNNDGDPAQLFDSNGNLVSEYN